MVENMEKALDDALSGLAREMRDAAPLPGPDLTARVLADAAAVAAEQAPSTAATGARESAPARGGLLDTLFGWTSGAFAAIAVCMSVGIAVGMEIDADDLPMLGQEESEIIDPMSSPEENPFGSEGFL